MKSFLNAADFLTESTAQINFSKTIFLYLFFLQNMHSLFNIVFFFQNCVIFLSYFLKIFLNYVFSKSSECLLFGVLILSRHDFHGKVLIT